METIQDHYMPQPTETDVQASQPTLDHRKLAINLARDLVQPFLAVRTFVQKHPHFDPDELVTKWERVLRAVSRFGESLGHELRVINGEKLPLDADPCSLPPAIPETEKTPRALAAQFISTIAGYAEDLLNYLLQHPDVFSPTVVMTKYATILLALQRYEFPLHTVVQHLCADRDPWVTRQPN
jgi:hypothetical protein